MATIKDEISKNKQQNFVNGNSQTTDTNNRYSNLNLNQNHKCPILIPVHSDSKSNNNKHHDSEVFDEKNVKSHALNVTSSVVLKNEVKSEDEKQWKNNEASKFSNNKSTLSLHISAYENSLETGDSNKIDNGFKKEGSIKKQENAIFIVSSKFVIHNTLEFPRQQNDKVQEPEIAQFIASQRLLTPNKASLSAETHRIPQQPDTKHVQKLGALVSFLCNLKKLLQVLFM